MIKVLSVFERNGTEGCRSADNPPSNAQSWNFHGEILGKFWKIKIQTSKKKDLYFEVTDKSIFHIFLMRRKVFSDDYMEDLKWIFYRSEYNSWHSIVLI